VSAARPAPAGEIYLGDLVRALNALQPADAAARQAIARVLGFDAAAPAQPPPAAPATPSRPPARPVQPRPPPGPASGEIPPPLPSVLNRVETGELSGGLDVRPLAVTPTAPAASPVPDPLLLPLWLRAIVTAACATLSREGPVDVPGLIDTLAQARPVTALPRRSWPTLQKGIHVLVDRSEALAPYSTDLAQLLDALQATVGREKTAIWSFSGTPLRRVWGDRAEPRLYLVPPPGTPVVLLTDLGIGRPLLATDRASTDEWALFAWLVRSKGCPLVAFVPYGPARWPAPLARTMILLGMQPGVTASAVRQRIGRGHGDRP
jgi:hypothetical protein